MKTSLLLNMTLLTAGLAFAATPKTALAVPRDHSEPDAGLVAAVDIQSNSLVEGIVLGDFETWYPGFYPGFSWARETTEIGSNGLFRLDYAVFDPHDKHGRSPQELSILRYRPGSMPGSASRGAFLPAPTPGFRAPGDHCQGPRAARSTVVLGVIEDALLTARRHNANARYYSFFGANQGLSLVARLPASFPGEDTFGGAPVRRVNFYLRAGKHGLGELAMEHAMLLLDLGQTEPYRVTLVEDVSVFHIRYWDPQRFEWMEQWPFTNALPRMVQVTLGLGKLHGRSGVPRELVSRIVALPATAVAGDIQGAGIPPGIPDRPPGFTNRPPGIPNRPPPGTNEPFLGAGTTAASGGHAGGNKEKRPAKLPKSHSNRDSRCDVDLEWLGRSGIELAKYILAEEASGPLGPVDSFLKKWAGGPGDSNSVVAGIPLQNYPLGRGSFSIRIVDTDRKFNINVADEVILRQALTLIGVEAAAHDVVTDSILDWRDPDDSLHLSGAENAYYLSLFPPYFAKNGPLDDLSELSWVRGVTPALYLGAAGGQAPVDAVGLADLFTPLSSRLININTASAAVLQLIPEIDQNTANAIISGPGGRTGPDGVDGTADDTPFRSPAELARILGVGNPAQLARYFTVRSLVFEVRVIARIDDEQRHFVALLRRNSPRDVQLMNFHWE